MSEPFIAEIKIFAGTFAPRDYAFCNGQLLPIAQNTALFSLVGTIYGGDGRTTFGLPNLQGRAALHAGHGPGLSSRFQGQTGGVTTVTLTEAQMPNHTHPVMVHNAPANQSQTTGNTLARSVAGNAYGPAGNLVPLANQILPPAGGGQAHQNMQPYLVMNFIIALLGIYPSRP
jgi:microcystin-dependent protein